MRARALLATIAVIGSLAISPPANASILTTTHGRAVGTNCTSTWVYQVQAGLSGGNAYSQVKWTSNPCGFVIEDRSICEGIYQNIYNTYSGRVSGTGIWDRASCRAFVDSINSAAKKYETATGWTGYVVYWSS